MRLVILGGSGSATPEFADALVDWPGGIERRPPLEIVLHARSGDRLALVATEMRRRLRGASGAEVQVTAETDAQVALRGADVVLNAVRIGGLTARIFDESFPQRHGLPGEETMGPGGLANALRTVPAVRQLWSEVARLAPAALAINLTNPSGIVVAATERASSLPVISVCDSPVVFCERIAERLGQPAEDVRRRYQGMNHMGWWTPSDTAELEATLDLASGQEAAAVRVQGAVGAPYVRYYVHPARILAAQLEAGETRAQQLQRLEAELLSGYAHGVTELPRRGAVWYGKAVLPLIDAWINGSPSVLILGLRNDGRIPGLPDEVITEGPVRIPQPGRLEPVATPPLPPLPASMLAQHAAFEALAATATLPGATRDDRVRAMMANPMVRSYDLAVSLVDDIAAGSPG
jgi:6-phospho-beta-glucosidase